MAMFFYEIAKEDDLADAARRAALRRSAADIFALEAEKRPANAALEGLKALAAEAKPGRATALLQPIEVLKEADIENYLLRTAWEGIDNFGFIAPDYKIADAVLTKYAKPKTLFAYMKVSLIIPFSHRVAADFAGWLACLKEWGFSSIALRLVKNARETAQSRAKTLTALGKCLELLQNTGFRAGIDGDVQPADIPRLLLFKPAMLGYFLVKEDMDFKGICHAFAPDNEDFLPLPEQQAIREQRAARLRQILAAPARQKPAPQESAAKGKAAAKGNAVAKPMAAAAASAAPVVAAGADKILVADFIVAMQIGAYQHEKGAAQRVCFNVAAEISGLPPRPQNMKDIFSYDIILDSITQLAGRGHWEFVENVAEELAAILLHFPCVAQVMVRVEKLDLAPRAVGIEICRRRG